MAIEARPLERPVLWAAAALWAGCAVYLAGRAWAYLYADLNPDEPVFIVQAWAVARGARLYAQSTSQHMPLITLLAQPLAALGLVRDPAPYRLMVLAAQLGAGLALALSPAFRAARWKGWLAGGVYLGLVGAFAPSLQGLVFTPYPFAGAAVVLSLAALALPLADGSEPSPAWALLGGGAFALWLLSSPALGIPALLFLSACALAPAMGRRAWRWALAGGLGVAALQALWMWRYASFLGWWRQAIVFNATIYPTLNREPGPGSLWNAAVGGAMGDLWTPGLPMLAVLAFPLAMLAAGWARRSLRQWGALALLAAFFFALHTRMYLWKGMPYWSCAWAGLGAALVWLPQARRWGMPLALTLGCALALSSARFLARDHGAASHGYWHQGTALAVEQRFDGLRPLLPPGSTLLALPDVSYLHMITGMPNVGGMIGYGPIAYIMEYHWPDRRFSPLCDQLVGKLPALIYDYRGSSMYHVPMTRCIPPCLDGLEKAGYTPIQGWRDWWVRKDLAPSLPKPLPPLLP